ncbi:hypothetical protein BGW41_001929 [Actinomortierella wolfii]|nr:hypothetical protein BGW41_001929 [Actinomortierella wolfii]
METRKHEQDHLKEDNEANKRIRNESTESKVSSMKTSTTSTTLLVPRVVTGLVPRRAVVGRLTTVSGRPRINRKAPAAFPVLASTKLAAVQTSNDSTSDVKQDVASDLSTDNVSKSIIHDPQTRSAHHSRNQQWEGSDSSGRENKPYDASAHKNLGEDQTPAPSEISVDKARRLKNIIPRPLNHTITRIKKNNRQEVAFPYGNYPRYYEGRVRAVIGAASQGKQQVKVRAYMCFIHINNCTFTTIPSTDIVSAINT